MPGGIFEKGTAKMNGLVMLLVFFVVLYIVFLLLPFITLGILSLIRYYRYREQLRGEARARQCGRDAAIFFALAFVSLLGLAAIIGWG